jgi:DNA-binding protein
VVDWLTAIYVSIPWATALSLVLYFVKNPEKAEKWYSILTRSVSYWSQRAERATVASDIQSDLSLFSKAFNEKVGEQIVPDGIKIEWEKGDVTREAFLSGNLVIVRMSHHRNQSRNFLNATLSYVTTGLLPDARHYLDPIIRRSLDLTVIRKVLSEKKRDSALQIFFEEIYEPEATKQPLIRNYQTIMDALDDQGLLNLILREFSDLGLVMHQKAPDDNVKRETIAYLRFLDKIVTRESGVDVPLDFQGDTIRSGIVLVARPELAQVGSVAPFVTAVLRAIDSGANTVYVVSRGHERQVCMEIARKVGDVFGLSPTIRKVAVLKQRLPFYKGRKMSSIIIILKSIQ